MGRTVVRLAAAALVVSAFLGVAVSSAWAATYDPRLVISNDNMRRKDSMSAADIQAFLETKPGPLKSLVTSDHAGVKRKASTIIWQACQEWSISPKVMLTMLQKEQSLLTRTSLAKNTLKRAIGAGCPDAKTNRYPGFGNQMWYGARMLDGYGENFFRPAVPLYFKGIRKQIYNPKTSGSWLIKRRVKKSNSTYETRYYIEPKNLATYKLFTYNPSVGAKSPFGNLASQAGRCTGSANFWLIYRRYFGSTFADPRMRKVYRFRNRHNGTYLYTSSAAERYRLTGQKKTWKLETAAFSWDASVTPAATTPLYRFYNKKTKRYSFVSAKATYDARTSTASARTWRYDGVAFRVAREYSTGAATVWRFTNKKTGGSFLTATKKTVAKYRTKSYARTWRYEGVAWYLPRSSFAETSTP